MAKQRNTPDINDDTKIVRFLNLYGAEKSVGSIEHGDIHCTFHFGRLNHYKVLETNAGDAKEGSTSINLGNGIVGSDATTNNALISCWSIWDGIEDPWVFFKDSSFAQDKKNICVITSTVGKVRKIFQQIIEINQKLLGENSGQIVFFSTDRPVTYYSKEHGVNQDHWNNITDVQSHGLGAKTVHNIFHKRDSDGAGRNYNAECEYRYAIILGNRYFFGSDTSIAMSAEELILQDYPLILMNGNHFIEKVYLRIAHPIIETTCWSAGIDLIKQTQSVEA